VAWVGIQKIFIYLKKIFILYVYEAAVASLS
jgi:hypothetical protein